MRPALVLLISLAAIPEALAQRATDERVWLGAGVDAGLGPRVGLGVEQQLRLGAEAGFDETHTQLQATVDVADPLRFGVLYRFIVLDGDVDTEVRHRVGADARLQVPIGDVTLGYRLRLQDTTRPGDDDQVLVRNRGMIGVRVHKRVEPFAMIEEHYQLSPNAEHRELRVEAGVEWRLTKALRLDTSYLYQTEANVMVPETNHIVVAAMVYRFGNLLKADDEAGSKE